MTERLTARLGPVLRHAMLECHSLVDRATLRSQGVSDRQIAQLVEDRVLERVVRGLYRIAGTWSPVQDIAAGVCRHRPARASHVSALHLFGLWKPSARPHITLPPGSTSRSRFAEMHRSPIDEIDRAVCEGIPTVTPARAIVDASEQLPVASIAEVINRALGRHAASVAGIVAAAQRVESAPGRVGLGRLRSALRGWTAAIEPDSVAEAAAIRRILRAGLPAPVTQHEIFDESGAFVARVDLAWPVQRVAREYDSVEFHGADRTEADELRREALEALGWRIDSLTRDDLPPSKTAWLRRLARDLGVATAEAS